MGTKDSKRAYQQLFSAVARTLRRHDPIGLVGMGAPDDEYDLEIARILQHLRAASNHEDVTTLIHEEFSRLFTAEVAGAPDRYEAASREIWSHWLAFRHAERSRRHDRVGQVPMERLRGAIRRFLANESDFAQFDREFMDAWMALPDDEPPPADADKWDEVYELVYMGAADPVHAEDRKVGVIGEAELRSQLATLYADLHGR